MPKHAIDWLIAQKVDPVTGEPMEQEQRIARQQLRQVVDYAESTVCRRTIQLGYFGETFVSPCHNCDNCNHPKPVVDWTIEAQMFLSCVARCQERFGSSHIIDVLRGSRSQRVLQKGHDQLSTYGIGKDHSVEEWRLLARTLLHQGLVNETTDGFPVLKLNAASWEVLRKKRSVLVALAPTSPDPAGLSRQDQERRELADALFQRLRSLRKELADAQSVPPYVVFADSSLRLMAQQQPQTLGEFTTISGVGSRKLAQYGDRFVAEIRAYRQELGLPLPSKSAPPPPVAPALPPTAQLATTLEVTLDLYQQGYTPTAIAEKRNLRLSTVMSHLADLIEQHQLVDLSQFVAAERQKLIEQAIAQVGPDSLTQIREVLGENYTYDEIKLVRAVWRREAEP